MYGWLPTMVAGHLGGGLLRLGLCPWPPRHRSRSAISRLGRGRDADTSSGNASSLAAADDD